MMNGSDYWGKSICQICTKFPSLVSNKIVQAFHQIDKPITNKIVENKKENIDTQTYEKWK